MVEWWAVSIEYSRARLRGCQKTVRQLQEYFVVRSDSKSTQASASSSAKSAGRGTLPKVENGSGQKSPRDARVARNDMSLAEMLRDTGPDDDKRKLLDRPQGSRPGRGKANEVLGV